MCARQCWRRGDAGGLCSIFLKILVGKKIKPNKKPTQNFKAFENSSCWGVTLWFLPPQLHPTSLSFVPAGCSGVPWSPCGVGGQEPTFFLLWHQSCLTAPSRGCCGWEGMEGEGKTQGKAERGKEWREWMRRFEQRQWPQAFPVVQWRSVFAI